MERRISDSGGSFCHRRPVGRKPKPLRRKPSFFKVLIGDFHTNLRFPPAFVKHFDGVVAHKTTLYAPAGGRRSWHVNVKNVGNDIFFQNGWSLFLKDNSAEYGDFLLFSYAENSRFSAKTYGKTCCEKEAAMVTHEQRQEQEKTIGGNQRGVKNGSNADRWGSKGLAHRSGLNREECKVIYINSDCSSDETCMCSLHDQSRTNENYRSPQRDDNFQLGKIKETMWKKSVGRQITREHLSSKVLLADEDQRAGGLKAAENFLPKYPFFKVAMQPSYLKRSTMCVPASFVRNYSKQSKQYYTMLQATDRSWPVKMFIYPNCTGRFSRGWAAFVKANTLREGDVCVFELIKRIDVFLKVSIFRCIG